MARYVSEGLDRNRWSGPVLTAWLITLGKGEQHMAFTIETAAQQTGTLPQTSDRRFPPLSVVDNGRVRLGAQGPCFRTTVIADAGKVRLGAQGPIFR